MTNPTTSRRPHTLRLRVPAALVTSLVLLVGCGSTSTPGEAGGTGTGVAPVEVDTDAAALLPSSIKSSKVLRVAVPTNEPPTQFYKPGTKVMTGVNPDVARLIGQALGVKVEILVANFDAIIPGIAAGRYDMTVSSMTPTEERMKVLDFVDYLQVGSSLAVPADNPDGLDEHSLCGKNVALLTGSYQLDNDIPRFDQECAKEGKPRIESASFQDTRQAISALVSGRANAVLADSPILTYAASKNSSVDIASKYDFTPVGVGISKEAQLVDAVAAALKTVIASDSYTEALGKYGLQSSAITAARVNAAQ